MDRPPWRRLEGKVVMVTGASSGIGREICLDLAAAGCRVVATARRIDRLRSLCDEIDGPGSPLPPPSSSLSARSASRSVAVELDVSAGGSVIEAAVQRAWDAFGRIDALINNAGVRGGVYSPLDWPEEDWNATFATNLTGLWLVTKYVCKQMVNAKLKGTVINISSISGLNRGKLPGAIAYAVSKEGVNAITKVMALEMGVHNIRVNSISPGIFKSEITESLMRKKWINKVATKMIPLRTFGTSDPAITSVVCYLIHDSSEYVTGNIFIVDAGATLPGFPVTSNKKRPIFRPCFPSPRAISRVSSSSRSSRSIALAMAAPKKVRAASRNPSLIRGIGKFSRSKMYHKRGIWAIKAKNGGSFPHHDPKPAEPAQSSAKPPKFYPADDVKTPIPNRRKPKPTKLRASITPGTVLILLAGRFMGKRVVFLKQLPSGLLLVTGPFKINGVPLRRVNQSYVIATSTKVDISGVNADKFHDKYFAKEKKEKTKKGEGEFFETEKEETKSLPQEKKDDQKAVDGPLIKAIEAVPDLKAYLGARFSLRSGMKPHELVF
ncbi:unnamed protein product [Musa hybrid cultivar]